ncbi:hypothetical protein X559_0763 [Paenilisteria newyorkensis]|nr:hypothetical protein X559_0763 [Listeria newyorkensis]
MTIIASNPEFVSARASLLGLYCSSAMAVRTRFLESAEMFD